jgi:putative membrane protein
MFAQLDATNPLPFRWHPEVVLLVISLTAAYIYMVREIGPRAVAPGTPVVTRKNKVAFVSAMLMLWGASDWPLHDISEEYLYSAHMLQHMMLAYFLPPLVLLATPEWLLRVLIGNGRGYRVLAWLCQPVVAGVAFNAVVIVTHIPTVVNRSVDNGPMHYGVHLTVVLLALLMWMPVCGPFREFHLQPLGKCIYLFLQSVVPTLPAAWLTFADGAVYSAYDLRYRLWGISITTDQQLAGAIMKTGGSVFLWAIVIFIFFKRFAAGYKDEHDYHRASRVPDAEIVGNDRVSDGVTLTTADVEREFAASIPVAGPGDEPTAQ